MTPKRPVDLSRWRATPSPFPQWHAWRRDGICVASAVELVEADPGQTGDALHYHVSVSVLTGLAFPERRVATDQEMEVVRAAFGMAGAEEDNHGPGIVRHLWLRCDLDRQPDCPCKQDEDRIVEGDRVRYETE